MRAKLVVAFLPLALLCSADAFARQRVQGVIHAPNASVGQARTINGAQPWRNTPATPERMRQRIEEAAVRYRDYAPVPRLILYDIGYPRDVLEYANLDGHAVVLLTALSQERVELPLRRVYVSVNGKEVELRLLKLVLSEQAADGDVTARTFGRFRADALYMLPLYLRTRAGDLLADFDRNRTGLKVAAFGTPLPDEISKLGIKPPTGVGPFADTLEEFIRREYPSFFKE
jgi:hypothetical protein